MATGLNFQTQTIINSNFDPDSKKLNGKGEDNTWLFKKVKYHEDDEAENVLCIKRDFQFHKNDDKGRVLSIRKKKGYAATMCKATIAFNSLTNVLVPKEEGGVNYCRLDIYLGIEGAEPYIYSTPWVQKGMPFWIEFVVKYGETGQNIAEKLAKMIKQNHVFLCDKDLINVSTSTDSLILEGATEYQRFKRIEISSFEVDDEYANKVAGIGDTGITLNEKGTNSFGTYSQIIKDLRLPTAANYQWTHIRQVETPIVGAIYDQYIIEYCGPSTNDGLHAVGQRMDSHTTHVFWVKNDTELINAWEEALKVIDPDGDSTINEENKSKSIEDRLSALEKA